MGRRMSYFVKRAKSKFEQFRMAVPTDLRDAVGKREWTHSLSTTDTLAADAERGRLIAIYKSEIKRLREVTVTREDDQAAALVDRALEKLSVRCGSMDAAMAQQLALLGVQICESWSPATYDRRQQCGDMVVYEPLPDFSPVPSIDDDLDRQIFRLRAEVIEGRGIADGYVYRELAAAVLQRRAFRDIEFVVSYLRTFEPGLNAVWRAAYDAIAERYLVRLTEYAFSSWPANIDRALKGARDATPPAHPAPSPSVTQTHPF